MSKKHKCKECPWSNSYVLLEITCSFCIPLKALLQILAHQISSFLPFPILHSFRTIALSLFLLRHSGAQGQIYWGFKHIANLMCCVKSGIGDLEWHVQDIKFLIKNDTCRSLDVKRSVCILQIKHGWLGVLPTNKVLTCHSSYNVYTLYPYLQSF